MKIVFRGVFVKKKLFDSIHVVYNPVWAISDISIKVDVRLLIV